VWQILDREGEADVLVLLDALVDLSLAPSQATREAQVRHVYEALQEAADQAQAPVLKLLRARGVKCQSFFLVNMIRVRADRALVLELAAQPDVARVLANREFRMVGPPLKAPASGTSLRATRDVEWNVARIRAPEVWAAYGVRGEGVVVAGNDTGVEWAHPALIQHYRGWDGSTATHDYNWHDAWDPTVEPWDDHGHGTHTVGTMVGDDGLGNQIGVAPGARWIACRNMDNGFGTPASYVECFQFFLAPTDLNGANPDPSKAPHVINNSWACIPSEGCDPSDPTWEDTIQPAVQALRAAGIMVVASAGNEGPSCGSVGNPPAIYPESFSVGAFDANDNIASFSSRGPVTMDGSNRLKPDVTAPGVRVRSSVPGGSYQDLTGTSMAAPHVAGVVALMWSAAPRLMGDVDLTEQIIRVTAQSKIDTTCGGDPSGRPNNVWGWGTVDALAAVEAARCAAYGDLDLDGVVDLDDLLIVAEGWGSQAGDGVYRRVWDMDEDGDVDVVDIATVANRWGQSCGG
jgi:subtilisin family serine protease